MFPESAGIDLVHGGEVGHVDQEHRGLHDVREVASCGGEDGAQVVERSGGLFPDSSGDQFTLVRIEGYLSGGKQEAVGPDSLAIGTDCLGRAGGGDKVQHQKSPSMVPSGSTRMDSAAGTLGSPGMVMMSPARATTNPAPAEG